MPCYYYTSPACCAIRTDDTVVCFRRSRIFPADSSRYLACCCLSVLLYVVRFWSGSAFADPEISRSRRPNTGILKNGTLYSWIQRAFSYSSSLTFVLAVCPSCEQCLHVRMSAVASGSDCMCARGTMENLLCTNRHGDLECRLRLSFRCHVKGLRRLLWAVGFLPPSVSSALQFPTFSRERGYFLRNSIQQHASLL